MNKVFTFCGVSSEGNRFEFVSGYFNGHVVCRRYILQMLALKRTPLFGHDLLFMIARHLWSMREQGEFVIAHWTALSETLNYDQQTEYVKEYHLALMPVAKSMMLDIVYFVVSDNRTHIKSSVLSLVDESKVKFVRVTRLEDYLSVQLRLTYSALQELNRKKAKLAMQMQSDL